MYQALVFTHLAGVFGFLMAHGVAVAVVFRVKAEKDITALRTLLTLSGRSLQAMYISLLALLIGGIGAAFVGHWWGFGWPWAASGVLAVVWTLMSSQTGPALRRVRVALGFSGPAQVTGEAKPDEVAAALARVNPWVGALTGGLGLLILLWLMLVKPF